MKKIIKVLLGGLVLSLVLVALFLSPFLKDDAKWTYQNDLGRVDVTLAGDAHNGQIDVTGKGLQLDRPQFYLDGKGNQGVMVHVPVSYLRTSYQVTLKPRGNAEEISLAMRFRGKDFRVRNQRKPAYVRFENIRVNGKAVAEEQTVWHDQSFLYQAKNISDNSMVTLNFDIQKPFSFTDIMWGEVIGWFVLCALSVFFLYDVIRKFVQSIIEQKEVMLSDVGRVLRLHKQKILILAILTLLANILCIPLWTELGYGGFMRTLFNEEARFDLLYTGEITRAEPFQYKVTPKPFNASWMYESGSNVHRANLSLRARGEWQRLSLQLKARRDGKITMLFGGPSVRDEYGVFYSVLTDWRNIQINGKSILPRRGAFSFIKKFITKQLSVKKDEVLQIEAEFRRHHFTIHDFTWLSSGSLWYLITGNLLFFFLTYRLLSYIQKGSIRRNDALFLATFFLFLFIPMIGISDAVKSARENRMLADKPELNDLFKEKCDYGRQYENWFNDHFCGRVSLIELHDVLRNKLSYIIRTKKNVYFKENGWAFRCPPMVPLFALDCKPVSLQSIVQNIVQLNEFCQQNQIKLYVLEVPHKELIYKELIKRKLGYNVNEVTKVSQALDFIRNEVRKKQIPYVYPYKELCDAAQQRFVFFKWGQHWTDWGAFVGYRALMKEVSKDFPDMPVVSLSDYQKFQSCFMRDDSLEDFRPPELYLLANLNYSGDFRISYDYYDHKNGDEMVFKFGRRSKDFFYPKGKRKIMVVGRSMNENLSRFLPWSAAETKYIRLNNRGVKGTDWFKVFKLYKNDIQGFKPDVFILSINSDDLPRLRDLFSIK